jgi:hypothetical protein
LSGLPSNIVLDIELLTRGGPAECVGRLLPLQRADAIFRASIVDVIEPCSYNLVPILLGGSRSLIILVVVDRAVPLAVAPTHAPPPATSFDIFFSTRTDRTALIKSPASIALKEIAPLASLGEAAGRSVRTDAHTPEPQNKTVHRDTGFQLK